MVSKMYAGSSLLKLVTLVLIIIIALLKKNSLVIHKVCGQYVDMVLLKKEHQKLHNMRIVQGSITNTHLNATAES